MKIYLNKIIYILLVNILFVYGCRNNFTSTAINSNSIDEQISVYTLKTPYQNSDTSIYVLLPDKKAPNQKYSALYILPVNPGPQAALTALKEAQRLTIQNRYNLICVSPAFEKMPWYADHPFDKHIRQESYFINTVVPFVDKSFPVKKKAENRFLLGYSKSGWGAWSLLLRHPKMFGCAASWDAPLMMDKIGKYLTSDIFGTQENFEQYRITNLLQNSAANLRQKPIRLILLGHSFFGQDDIQIDQLMNSFSIPHYWDHGSTLKHSWDSGWMENAVKIMMQNQTNK